MHYPAIFWSQNMHYPQNVLRQIYTERKIGRSEIYSERKMYDDKEILIYHLNQPSSLLRLR